MSEVRNRLGKVGGRKEVPFFVRGAGWEGVSIVRNQTRAPEFEKFFGKRKMAALCRNYIDKDNPRSFSCLWE